MSIASFVMSMRVRALVLLLPTLLVGGGLALVTAPVASAAQPAFVCNNNTVYSVNGNTFAISRINADAGTSSGNGSFTTNADTVNALALSSAGRYIYGFNRSGNQVLRYDATTETTSSYAMPANSNSGAVVAGAINPANGIYYYATGGATWTVYAFNTNTNTAIGQVATVSGTGLSGNGDWAFDALGNLFIVSNANATASGTLTRVNGSLPTTAGSTALTVSVLASTPGNAGQYASAAFDSSGNIVIGTSTGTLVQVNPVTGATVSSKSTGLFLSDMASCAVPSTALAQVNLPSGRYNDTDQFGVAITGGGLTSGNTGTTNGTDTGLQNGAGETAGTVFVNPGTTYTITQTAASGTNLNNYTTTWRCVLASDNSVVASGTGSSGSFTAPSAAGSSVVCTFTNVPLVPSIGLDKTAGAINDLDGNGPDAGDTITYSFKVTNTGTVTLNPVTVSDPKVGPITCPAGALAPGNSANCTPKTYTLTQADVNAGKVDNTATASGTSPTGAVVTSPDSVSTPVTRTPAIQLTKSAGAINDVDGNGPDAGDTITYSFAVKNTGNVTLNPVTVSDPKLGSITCPTGALAPGDTVNCTPKSYTLTQADVNAGKVDNTATAEGTAPNGTKVTDPDSVTTTVPSLAAIQLTKTAGLINDVDGNGPDAGDTITYSFAVKNTGNVPLNPVTVSDPKLGSITCPAGALAPGDTVNCTPKSYPLTQADVNAGKVDNTATAEGTAPGGAKVTDTDSTTTTIPAQASISLVKTASAIDDVDGNGPDAGDTITYSFAVTNTGNVPLNPVTVSDPKLGAITCPTGALAPGDTVNCTPRSYTLTQADVNAGKVDNTATAEGTTPGGTKVTDTDSTTTPIVANASIRLVKTAGAIDDVDGNGPDAGDTITYTFTVTNTGNVPLTGINVADPKVGPVTCPPATLEPGDSVDCSPRTYTITAADVTAGKVDNTATATGTAPGGSVVEDGDSTNTPVVPVVPMTSNLVISKDVDKASPRVGDTVTYTLTVKNEGSAAANDVVVTDQLPDGVTFVSATAPCAEAAGTVTCALGSLAAGATRTVTITATVDPVDGATPAHSHLIDVQKVEAQVDLEPGQTRTVDVSCAPGYVVTDGSGRIDQVDQGTGTYGSVFVTESRATGTGTWQATFVNQATGRAQGKVFAVCVQQQSEEVLGHTHQVVLDADQLSATRPIAPGATSVTLECDPGYRPVQPGYVLDGTARVPTSYPVGSTGWRWEVRADADSTATSGTFTMRCLQETTSSTDGHAHQLDLDEVRSTVTLAPGETREFELSCADDAKGIVAGYDADPGLLVLGNDPRPKIRVFRFSNPTDKPLQADIWLLCLSVRDAGTTSGEPRVVNTARVTTSTSETTTTDNSDSAEFLVDTSAPPAPIASPAAPRVVVKATAVTAQVRCSTAGTCRGVAQLVATKNVRVQGKLIRKGTVLAKTTYSIGAGKKVVLKLKKTAAGKKALKGTKIRKAKLQVGATSRTVTVRR